MMSRRAVAAAEAVVAAAVVIGHNILRVVPNEVVVLVLVGAVSCALRRQSLKAIGYRRPPSWRNTAAVALAVAAALQVFSIFVVDPLAIRFTGQTADLSDFQPVVGNMKLAAIYLLVIWSFAAFGEEFAYRGYLLRRTIDALGGSTRGAVAREGGLVSVGQAAGGPRCVAGRRGAPGRPGGWPCRAGRARGALPSRCAERAPLASACGRPSEAAKDRPT